MAQQSFAGVAVLIALLFAVMALQACASSEHAVTESHGPHTPEFHGAFIGDDTLRSRLSSDG